MLNIIGEDKPVQNWVGTSLRHFGITPYGESLFRVIWAPSRMRMIGGRHTVRDGKPQIDRDVVANGGRDNSVVREFVGYKWYPMYPRKQSYILEKWLSPVEYGGTRENYETQQRCAETGLLVSGPYPERGEYFFCYEFPDGYPAVSAVESIIRLILFGRNFTIREKRDAILEADKREQLSIRKRATDVILDSLPAFGLKAANTNPSRRKPEDYELKYSANELGLPVGNNKIFTKSAVKRG